jgi:hypothetical protein
MQLLNGQYAQAFNRRHGYVGHLFQARFSASRVDDDAYSIQVGRYVVLNPVRAGMVAEAVEWKWSSHRATLGKVAPPPFLDVEWTIGQFSRRRDFALEAYANFVKAGERELERARLEKRGQAPGQGPQGHAPYD